MIDKYLSANIEDNDTLSADVQDEDVQAEMPKFVAMGGGSGKDGFSPIVSLAKEGKVSTLEITDKNGVHKTEILDGADGKDGLNGTDGEDGQDGFSPIVTVTDIEGGHKVTITDKDGEKTFEVMDGKDGQGGTAGGKAIIDVIELPAENIDEDSFYRLLTGTFVYNQYVQNGLTCYCVEGLPAVGEPVTTNMVNVTAYYNIADNDVYGYVDANLSMALGVPIGWYTLAMLAPSFDVSWGGVITDILDDPKDGKVRLLLNTEMHSHKRGKWTRYKTTDDESESGEDVEVRAANADWAEYDPEAEGYVKNRTHYEVPKIVDISWDGDMMSRTVLDLSPLGMSGAYLVKVSDRVYTKEELVGKKYTNNDGLEDTIVNDFVEPLAGVFAYSSFDFGVVYSAEDFNASIGAPNGYYTNGTYFMSVPSFGVYVNEIYTEKYIKKLDDKYLPETILTKTTINGGTLECILGKGWKTYTVEELDIGGGTWAENWESIRGNIIDVDVGIQVSSTLGYHEEMMFCMSNDNDCVGVSSEILNNGNILFEAYLMVDIDKKTVSVMAKEVPTEPTLTKSQVQAMIDEAIAKLG